MMQRFERNRLLMRCGFFSEISNLSAPVNASEIKFEARISSSIIDSLWRVSLFPASDKSASLLVSAASGQPETHVRSDGSFARKRPSRNRRSSPF
jgi:hypothetical protein